VGLLDELEQEAQRRKVGDDESLRRKNERELSYRTRLEPALDALHAFLAELTAKVRSLQPNTPMRYQIPGYGEIVAYIEHEYVLKDVKQPSSREIQLDFPCTIATDECPLVEIEGASRVRAISGFFQRHHIGGLTGPRKDASGEVVAATFRAKGRIPLGASFHADAESGQLRMSFVNFDNLGTTVKSIAAEQVDQALYEQIGRYLVREPNTLLREDLPEAYRKQLRSKVQQAEIKRRWETRITENRETELAQMRGAYTTTGRIKLFFDRVKNAGGIGAAFARMRGLLGRGGK